MIPIQQIRLDHKRIKSFIHNTIVLKSSTLNNLSGASLFFKCENFQKSGSFKIRGASNTILQIKKENQKKGVVTASSGNHGAAIASIATKLGLKSTIVMPENTPKIKVNNVIRNGGEIIWCAPNIISREKVLNDIILKTEKILVHPYNDERVIAGQATAALEFLEIYKDLEILIAPVSGGGLLSGTISTAKQLNHNIKIYGAEPFNADDAFRSLISGKIESNLEANTICDGLRAQLGDKTFPIIKKHIESIIRVKEIDIVKAMKLSWQCLKILIEPSCAIALAAVLENKSIFKNKKVGIIISGGNVDLDGLPWITNNA